MSHGKEQNTAQGYFCAIWDNGLGRAEMQKITRSAIPGLLRFHLRILIMSNRIKCSQKHKNIVEQNIRLRLFGQNAIDWRELYE